MADSNLRRISYKKGDIFFREGDFDDLSLYHIMWGAVGIYANYGKPDEKLLTKLQPEDFFGEMGLIEGRPRSATAVALDSTQVLKISADELSQYFEEKPQKVLQIMQYMSSRMRELSNDYLDACDTIRDYLESNKEIEEKSPSLFERMKRFAGFSRKG